MATYAEIARDRFPEAVIRPSSIPHPMRTETRGGVIHWTAGFEAGDLAVLDGPSVDIQFWIGMSGKVVQFLDPDSVAWHAKTTANLTCVGIEHEGSGSPWTERQLWASAALSAWLCHRYDFPPVHVDPPMSWRGLFGHRDLSLGGPRVDGNDHTDTVPDGTGWPRYLAAIQLELGAIERPEPPGGASLRLAVGKKRWAGWDECMGPMEWIRRNGLRDSTACAIAWRGDVWRGATKVENVTENLLRRFT